MSSNTQAVKSVSIEALGELEITFFWVYVLTKVVAMQIARLTKQRNQMPYSLGGGRRRIKNAIASPTTAQTTTMESASKLEKLGTCIPLML